MFGMTHPYERNSGQQTWAQWLEGMHIFVLAQHKPTHLEALDSTKVCFIAGLEQKYGHPINQFKHCLEGTDKMF